MFPIRTSFSALATVAGLISFTLPLSAQESRPDYTPIPPGYGFFENTKALQAAVDQDDRAAVRAHGWKLWAGIMQPLKPSEANSWPLWISWPTGSQAFPQDKAQPAKHPVSIKMSPNSVLARTAPVNTAEVPVGTDGPKYPIPEPVQKAYKDALKETKQGLSLYDGSYFAFNGDIMIATESMSAVSFEAIETGGLNQVSTLEALKKDKENIDLPAEAVFTKHMYWPVKQDGLTALPWLNSKQFKSDFPGYWGYEIWDEVVAIDPGNSQKKEAEVSFLYGVLEFGGEPMATRTVTAPVVSIDDFYHHKITQKDWDAFNDEDKAILNAASHWLYNESFGPGDYLVSVAMHVFTKEVPTWTLQSTWWSQAPNDGPYALDRPVLPDAVGPWQNYLLTQGTQTKPEPDGNLKISVNPYIEGVTHPIATSCRNCHQRAGYPFGKTKGTTGYQTDDCPGLLSPLTAKSSCFDGVMLSDFSWAIPGRAK
jgi:hypothetical protein